MGATVATMMLVIILVGVLFYLFFIQRRLQAAASFTNLGQSKLPTSLPRAAAARTARLPRRRWIALRAHRAPDSR